MLMNCPECELQVSSRAVSCPHCGYPLQSPRKLPKALRRPNSRQSSKRRRLPNGFGQISEIRNRNLRRPFRAMVSVGQQKNGRPRCLPLRPVAYFETYNDAYAALVEYNRNPYDLSPAITVRELYEKWSQSYFETLRTDASARAIESSFAYCSAVYDMRAMDLRARHIKSCMEEGTAVVYGREQHPSPTMQNKIKSLFNLMLDYALEFELVDRNYARTFHLSEETVRKIQTVKRSHIPFDENEMDLLWRHLEDKQCVDILLVQCYSGWRPQELGLLELRNIDLEHWTFTGGMKTEAGSGRAVPIHSRIRPIVEKRYHEAERLGSDWLFNYSDPDSRSGSTRLTYNRYRLAFCRIRDDLGLNPDHRPHDGRKHFVTMAKKHGVDEYAIKYIVGHKISDITEKVYTEREFSWLSEEIEKIR